MKPYYEEAGITLYHGDSRDVLPCLPEGSIDLVFTSPPYNMGISTGGGIKSGVNGGKWPHPDLSDGYDGNDDALPMAEYEELHRGILTRLWGLLSETGAIYYNHKPRVQNGELWLPLRLNPGLPLRQIIIWERAGGINFSPSYYLPTHEWIMLFAKPAFRLRTVGASGVGDIWRVPQEANPLHPAPFPIALPLKALETVTAQRILDPFAGIASTLIAAKMAGRRAIGIEQSEKYCERAAVRLQQSVMQFPAAEEDPDRPRQSSMAFL